MQAASPVPALAPTVLDKAPVYLPGIHQGKRIEDAARLTVIGGEVYPSGPADPVEWLAIKTEAVFGNYYTFGFAGAVGDDKDVSAVMKEPYSVCLHVVRRTKLFPVLRVLAGEEPVRSRSVRIERAHGVLRNSDSGVHVRQ